MARLVLALVVLALLAAVPAAAQNLPPGGKFGGELRVALPAAAGVDPATFPANRLPQELVYDALVRLGPDERPVASLASGRTVDPAASTITFVLRTATWNDGTAIDAADVAWSFQRHVANGLASGFTVAAIGTDTVRFTFTAGGGDFLGNAARLPVAWKDGSTTATPNGPYATAALTATSLSLDANDRFWAGRPYFDRVTFLFPYTFALNPDGSTQATDGGCALMLKQVDLIGWPLRQSEMNAPRDCVAGFGGFPDGLNHTISDPARGIPHVGATESPGLTFLYVGFNTQRAPLSDPRLRNAISRAVDRDLIAGTYGGAIEAKTDIADAPVSPANAAWFNASVPKYRVPRVVSGTTAATTLEQVNQLLNAAGYLDRDSDGWRDDPSGQPFSFTLLTYDQANDPRVAKYLDFITKFQAIGINVVQEEHTPAELRAIVASNAFDLFVDLATVRGEPSFLFEMFHSTGTSNTVDLASLKLDAILETARDAIDPTVRRQAVLDAQGWIAENAPIATIVHFRAANALDRLAYENWSVQLGGVANYWSFTGAHVTQHGPLSVTVDALDNGLPSRESTVIVVRVRDTGGGAVPSASLWVDIDGVGVSGVTDASGQFQMGWTAPEVAADRDVVITAEAAKPGYIGATGSATITVHPHLREFIVSLAKGAPTIDSGNETFVRVIVRELETASLVPGATVTLTISPAGLGGAVEVASGTTDSAGTFETVFRGDTRALTRFLITATVSMPGFEDASEATSVEVSARPGTGAPPTPALDTISMVGVVATMAALFGVWKRRKWIGRKP